MRCTASSAAPRLFNTDRIDHLYQDPHETGRQFILHHGDLTDSSSLIRIIQQVSRTRSTTWPRRAMSPSASRNPNTPPTPTPWGPCASWRPSASWAWKRRPVSTRPAPPNCSAWCRRPRRRRPPPSTPALPTPAPSSTPTGSRSTTARPRHVCLQRHPVQPRIPGAGRNLRHPQDHPGPGPHQAGAAGLPVPRQPGCQTRLGPRQGLRRDAVADAAAGAAGRLRHRHRRAVLGPRLCRCRRQGTGHGHPLGRPRCRRKRLPPLARKRERGRGRGREAHRRRRPALLPPHRGGDPAGRPKQSQSETGLDPKISFDELVAEMVREDLKAAERDELVKKHGYKTMTTTSEAMELNARIYVAGHRGLVGSALMRNLQSQGLLPTSSPAPTPNWT